MIISELTPEYCTHLLAKGFTDAVRAFTRRLRSKPELVMAFERVFDDLVYDAAIDWKGTPSQEALFLHAEQCLEEMDSFLATMPSPYTSFVVVLNHGSEVTVEIGCAS